MRKPKDAKPLGTGFVDTYYEPIPPDRIPKFYCRRCGYNGTVDELLAKESDNDQPLDTMCVWCPRCKRRVTKWK
jgi:hypothetical protein